MLINAGWQSQVEEPVGLLTIVKRVQVSIEPLEGGLVIILS